MTNIYIYIYQKSIYRGTLSVTVTGPTEIKHNGQKTGFMCYKHSFIAKGPYTLMLYNGYVISDRRYIRFLIGSIHGVSNWDFRNRGVRGYDVVYVYFYEKDPRPLLFCYNNKAYAPEDKERYFDEWVLEKSITKCVCEREEQIDPLLNALVKVVGFLNRVELQMHPSGTDGKECSSSSGALSEGSTCPDKNGKTCKYVVHEHEKKLLQVRMPMERRVVQRPVDSRSVKVRVKCESVTPGNDTCYKKLTHEPVGFNGDGSADGDGFRLGNIIYNGNDGRENGRIQYYTGNGDGNLSDHWRKPLLKVTAYFYNEDTKYLDPLLVVLEFKNNEQGVGNVHEWYRLKTTIELGDMRWEKDDSASCKMRYTPFKYLDSIRYQFKKVLKVKLECKGGTKYPAMGRAAGTDNVFEQLNGKEVDVAECTEGKCPQLSEHKYKCFVHQISKLGPDHLYKIGGVAFTIPNENGEENVIELYKNGSETTKEDASTCQNGENGQKGTPINPTYNKCMGDVYVYFYGSDPRPLMLCYDGSAYIPKNKDKYNSEWVRATGIDKCLCEGTVECVNCDKLLKALVEVCNFLNPVQIDQINGEETSYVVHEFNGQNIQITVKSENASGTFCYNRYTHIHHGIGSGGEGFRLGNIEYRGECIKLKDNSGSNGKCITSVLGNGSPYTAASEVVVYYYKEDTNHLDPLLVALCKKGSGPANGTVCECYKLTRREESKMTWEKETEPGAKHKVEANGVGLVKYLDSIRYGLKQVLKVEIHWNRPTKYPAMGRAGKDTGGVFTKLNGGKDVNVVNFENGTCQKLKESNYKCVVHRISQLGPDNLHKIGGVVFTIPGKNGQGDKPIEIKLFNAWYVEITEIRQIYYNTCMGDIYMFFYDKGRGGVDKVPLMLYFNNKWYKPESRDKYFEKWVRVSGLTGQGAPCDGGDVNGLVKKLDEVNRALNQIDLDPEKAKKAKLAGTSYTGYGLPESVVGSSGRKVNVDTSKFPTMRVALTRQEGPKKPPNNHAYVKVVHRTVNGFEIGEITYKKQDILEDGIAPNDDGTKIEVNKNGSSGPNGNKTHNDLVPTHKWNTVVAYYSIGDTTYQLPQLIVILRTRWVIEPVKASETEYGYYILSSKDGTSGDRTAESVNYEYVWHPVNEQTQVILDDETDFTLLNSAVILLEQQCKGGKTSGYNDNEIKKAITSAKLSSPGREGTEINRFTGKEICVKEETEGKGKCLNEANFKVITHNISELVNPNGKLNKITLIAGLRFLIPIGAGGKYDQLKVLESETSGKSNGKELFIYHQPKGDNNKICVYFYGDDPRPLMLCYNNSAYGAKNMNDYFDKWVKVKDSDVKKCLCTAGDSDCDKLLAALVKVSNILNPVYINRVPRGNCTSSCYYVHWFGGRILMKVEKIISAIEGFCYNGYMHSPEISGFRLGNILYNGECIQLEGASGTNGCITSVLENGDDAKNHKSADKVMVYYYGGDKDHKNPLLVALKTSNGTYEPYYELVLSDSEDIRSAVKKYKKCDKNIELSDCPGGTLSQTLDKILSKIRKKVLQIIIDKIPMPTLYCPPPLKKHLPNGKKDKEEHPFKCEEKENGKLGTPGKKNPSDDVIPASYKAQLYNPDGSPLQNGSPPKAATKDVKVTLLDCWQLTRHGYRCYEHQITSLDKVEEIGGLKFYLWDNTDKGGSSPSCRELCLYKASGGSAPDGAEGTNSCPATAASPESTQTSCTTAPDSNLELVTTTYTTCKGNVYVFFYGEDPRPLMLCYDGNAYGPRCVSEYDCRWVCVGAVTGCVLVRRYVLLVIFHTIFNLFVVFTKMIAQIFRLH